MDHDTGQKGDMGQKDVTGQTGDTGQTDATGQTGGFFLNRRDWTSYLSALQSAATYPKVLEAVKSGRDWFAEATQASNWLVGSAGLRDKLSTG
jgi:hypothetical protein